MRQLVDLEGASDYTGFTVATLRRRGNKGDFIKPTDTTQDGTSWWDVDALDKWLKTREGKKGRRTPPLTERTKK